MEENERMPSGGTDSIPNLDSNLDFKSKSKSNALPSLPPDLADEVSAINAIFGPETLTQVPTSYSSASAIASSSSHSLILLLSPPPPHPLYTTPLLLSFAETYPAAPSPSPSSFPHSSCPLLVLGAYSVAPGLGKGAGIRAAERARRVLEAGETWRAGEVCVYELLTGLEGEGDGEAGGDDGQEAEERTEERGGIGMGKVDRASHAGIEGKGDYNWENTASASAPALHENTTVSAPLLYIPAPSSPLSIPSLQPPPPSFQPTWTLSAPLTIKKSVFQAHACLVSSTQEVQLATEALLASNNKVARASHNIRAWRIVQTTSAKSPSSTTKETTKPTSKSTKPSTSSSTTATLATTNDTNRDLLFQDRDSDGETGAGGRVLGVMQAMGVWGVLVVVSRLYGGVHLGPDRFRAIGAVAREVLVEGGWGAGSEGGGGGGGGGGGRGGGGKGTGQARKAK